MSLTAFSVRPSAAIAVAVLASACTGLLGIDGNYAAEPSPSQGSGGKQSAGGASSTGASRAIGFDAGPGDGGEGPGGSAGARALDAGGGGKTGPSSGGASAGGSSAGGMPSNGGKVGGGSGGMPSGGSGAGMNGSGGAPPDSGAPACPTGTFHGTYMGTHHPSSGGTAFAATIAGDITLHLAASAAGHLSVTGTLVDPLDDATGGIAVSFSGTIDCAKATGSAPLQKGQVTTFVPAMLLAPIDGTIDMSIDSDTSLSGDFAFHESLNPPAMGSATWSADRTGN